MLGTRSSYVCSKEESFMIYRDFWHWSNWFCFYIWWEIVKFFSFERMIKFSAWDMYVVLVSKNKYKICLEVSTKFLIERTYSSKNLKTFAKRILFTQGLVFEPYLAICTPHFGWKQSFFSEATDFYFSQNFNI